MPLLADVIKPNEYPKNSFINHVYKFIDPAWAILFCLSLKQRKPVWLSVLICWDLVCLRRSWSHACNFVKLELDAILMQCISNREWVSLTLFQPKTLRVNIFCYINPNHPINTLFRIIRTISFQPNTFRVNRVIFIIVISFSITVKDLSFHRYLLHNAWFIRSEFNNYF